MTDRKRDSRLPVWLESVDQRAAECRSCGAPCYWARTKNGCAALVDLGTVDGKFVSHFATCPDSDRHRHLRPRKDRPTIREEPHPGDATR